MKGLIVSGTDTGVGKTIVAAGLAGALGAAYWKPVQAGLDGGTDSETVLRLSGLAAADVLPESYRLTTPCSPHQAARVEGRTIDLEQISLPPVDRRLIVEGAGGLLVPLSSDRLMIDLFERLRLPVLLVARTTLGTINHSLLSIAALRARSIPLLGVLFVGDANPPSEAAIVDFGQTIHLGRLPWLSPLNRGALHSAIHASIQLDLLA